MVADIDPMSEDAYDRAMTGDQKEPAPERARKPTAIEEQLQLAEQYFEAGDFRRTRQIAKKLKPQCAKLDVEDAARLRKIEQATSVDHYVIAGFAVTLGLIIYLFVHYVL